MRIEDVLGTTPATAQPPSPGTYSTPSTPETPVAPQAERPEPTLEDLNNAGPYCYISGPAGTGKTWLARQLAQRPDTVLCATTGIAAVNLGDAVTINSLLGFFDTESLMQALAEGRLQMRLRGLLRMGVRRLVIDEISMLSGDQLTILLQAIDEVATTSKYDQDLEQVQTVEHEDRRMGLVLVGDFAQLPPVKAPFAFESPEWHRFAEETYKLRTIRRQGDQAFVAALQAVRRGQPEAALETLRPRLTNRLNLLDFDGTTIMAKNEEVDRINGLRHAKLPGTPVVWPTARSGEQQKEWVRLIPEQVSLKPGALVMILANRYNDDGDYAERWLEYANGETGVVEGIDADGIVVTLHRTGHPITVTPIVREWKEPYQETETEKADREHRSKAAGIKIPKPKYRIRGSVQYMPLRLAYATTVHKSQGLSLDRVQIGLSNWMFNQPGMTYVALSRCRTLEGLTIVATERLVLGRCSVDPKVTKWI